MNHAQQYSGRLFPYFRNCFKHLACVDPVSIDYLLDPHIWCGQYTAAIATFMTRNEMEASDRVKPMRSLQYLNCKMLIK